MLERWYRPTNFWFHPLAIEPSPWSSLKRSSRWTTCFLLGNSISQNRDASICRWRNFFTQKYFILPLPLSIVRSGWSSSFYPSDLKKTMGAQYLKIGSFLYVGEVELRQSKVKRTDYRWSSNLKNQRNAGHSPRPVILLVPSIFDLFREQQKHSDRFSCMQMILE